MVEQKIALIGAGSHFTMGVVSDIILDGNLNGSTIALVDINPKALATTEKIVRRIVEKSGADLKVESGTSAKDVLGGCDFVINSIAKGNHREVWKLDIDIPAKYGIYQTVGDTVGPGGLSRALRTIPEILKICEHMEDLCPNAVMFNFTNPMSCVVRAVHRATKVRAIGLCHGLYHTTRFLLKVLGVPLPEGRYQIPDDVTVTAGGINHLTWVVDFKVHGEDAFPKLTRRLSEADSKTILLDWDRERKFLQSYELFKIFGSWPSCYDRHICEFFPWFLRKEGRLSEVDNVWPIKELEKGWSGYTSPLRWYFEDFLERERQEAEKFADGTLPIDEYVFHGYDESADRTQKLFQACREIVIPLVTSIALDKSYIAFAANVPNNGCVTNLPSDAVLEIPCVFSGSGARGISLGDLPKGIVGILAKRVSQQELTVQAALTGDKDVALQALLLDELVPSLGVAKQVLDELLRAHADNLPDYWRVT